MCEDHSNDPALNAKMKDNTALISGCGCAIVDVEDCGRVVYDYMKLVDHFHEHDGMKELDEEGEEYITAMEWIDFNIIGVSVGADYIGFRVVNDDILDVCDSDYCGCEEEEDDE